MHSNLVESSGILFLGVIGSLFLFVCPHRTLQLAIFWQSKRLFSGNNKNDFIIHWKMRRSSFVLQAIIFCKLVGSKYNCFQAKKVRLKIVSKCGILSAWFQHFSSSSWCYLYVRNREKKLHKTRRQLDLMLIVRIHPNGFMTR